MQRTAYLETTIPSYLAAHPSRDLVVAAHQQVTHDWWRTARQRFDFFISAAVLEEIRRGDPDAAARRLEIIQDLAILELNDDVQSLARCTIESYAFRKKRVSMCCTLRSR